MDFFEARAPWYLAGPLIGLCVIGLRWAANLHLGATGAFAGLSRLLRKPGDGPSWRVWFLVGVVGGGALSAIVGGGWHPTWAFGSFDHAFGDWIGAKAIVLFGAGTLIGFGARAAGGCTSGHGICGTSIGSPGSWVATATFMGTSMAVAHALAVVL